MQTFVVLKHWKLPTNEVFLSNHYTSCFLSTWHQMTANCWHLWWTATSKKSLTNAGHYWTIIIWHAASCGRGKLYKDSPYVCSLIPVRSKGIWEWNRPVSGSGLLCSFYCTPAEVFEISIFSYQDRIIVKPEHVANSLYVGLGSAFKWFMRKLHRASGNSYKSLEPVVLLAG